MGNAIPDHPATRRERALSFLMHCYPFKSGCGTITNSSVFAKLAGSRNVNLWADVKGGKALVPSLDLVGRSMFFAGDLDPKVSWAIDRFVKPGDVVLDIGANLGLMTLRLAEKVGPSGAVHAFEPNPVMLQYLDTTLARNSHRQISLHRIALGSVATTLSLMVPKVNAGAASFVDVGGREVDHTIEVPVIRLDDFIADQKVSRVDFIKMDVEGFESEVLKGASDLFQRLKPRVILFEENGRIDGPELPDALRILLGHGYTLFGLPKRLLSVKMVPLDAVRKIGAHDFVAIRT